VTLALPFDALWQDDAIALDAVGRRRIGHVVSMLLFPRPARIRTPFVNDATVRERSRRFLSPARKH
jgi:hypothetical protein